MTNKAKLGLGTVQFGLPYGISNSEGQTPIGEVASILKIAKANGIQILDCASAYGNAEQILGENDLSSFRVISKFMPPIPGKTVENQLLESLTNLNITSFYGYLAHRPMGLLDSPTQWQDLQDLKTRGKVKKIGYSLNEPQELRLLLKEGFIPDLIQVPYNYFDRRFEEDMKDLKNSGCEIHTRSTFLQGLFFLDPDDLDDFFAEVRPLLKEIRKDKVSLGSKLLKFCLVRSFIDHVIIGVENKDQLIQNIEGLNFAEDLPELKKNISGEILIPSGWPKK